MNRVAIATLTALVVATALVSTGLAADPPADRVIVMYFHRTQRCPTCLKMGSYSEEAVKDGFSKQVKEGTVEFHYVDFQDKKNAALAKAYQIEGPALIVVNVEKNRVKEYKNLEDIWTHVREKDGFLKYVRENIVDYTK